MGCAAPPLRQAFPCCTASHIRSTPCPTCLQFGQQEPGSNEEIAAFAKSQHSASFPLFAKVDVNGASAAPLFTWLKANTPGARWGGEGKGAGFGLASLRACWPLGAALEPCLQHAAAAGAQPPVEGGEARAAGGRRKHSRAVGIFSCVTDTLCAHLPCRRGREA